jgi:predicted nucleic acid-binding protein
VSTFVGHPTPAASQHHDVATGSTDPRTGLPVVEHVHHEAATEWLAASDAGFATCPMAQGSLLRFLLRHGHPTSAARQVVVAVATADRHEFWSDAVPFDEARLDGVAELVPSGDR